MSRGTIVIGLVVCLLAGCGGKSPQIPSRRLGSKPQADSSTLALMEMNYRLAVAADEELMQIAQAQEEPYALYEGSAWVRITDKGDEERPVKNGEMCSLRIRTYTLGGRLLTDVEQDWKIGVFDLPLAIDRNISSWNHGGHVRMYAPWYSAYGMKGNEDVPPYENVIIELDIR